LNVARDEIPRQIGRYQIIDLVGFGAMGAVYKAFDPLIKRTVAIKAIRLDVPPQSPQYHSFIDRFYHEARVSGTLSHSNIITLFDIGETEERVPFLAMEYVEGETVSDLLSRGVHFRPEQVIGLVSQMASAIDYAHEKNVVHRDIKPSNILIHDGEKVKITDFGIAKLVDSELTQGGTLLGTPSYMSPEQAMGEKVDGRADIFSLGVVAFEMLSGEQPFPGNNVTSILYKLVHSDPVRPSNLEVLGLLPDKWHNVFSVVLAKNPADRYPTAAGFVRGLELCLGSWFGSLSGETVIIARPGAPLGDGDETMSTTLSQAGPTGRSSETEPTVVISGAPVPATPPPVFLKALSPAKDADYKSQRGSDQDFPTVVETGRTTPAARAYERDSPAAHFQRRSAPPDPPHSSVLPIAELPLQPPPKPAAVPPPEPPPAGRIHRFRLVAGLVALAMTAGIAVVWLLRSSGEQTVPAVEPMPEPMPAPAPPLLLGEIQVDTEPPGAEVRLNGEPRGVTPLRLGELGLGDYLLHLEMVGYQPEEVQVALTTETPAAVVGPMSLKKVGRPRAARATLDIESTPQGADVLIDGTSAGRTPLAGLAVDPGKRLVRIELDGFLPWERDMVLEGGQRASVSAALAPVPKAPEPPPPPPPEPIVREGDLVEPGPDVTAPRCLKCEPARYPDAARRLRQEGLVQVSFVVSEHGLVQDLRVEQSAGETLDRSVIEAVKEWRYEPATKKAVRVRMRLVINQRFKLGR
jgi:TonB family protein